MRKLRALDLFCGGGGATKGLQMAGFHVTGVDINPQPRYCGDVFHQADALTFPIDGFDFVWTSPPCQAYTTQGKHKEGHPQLISPVRRKLSGNGPEFVIENVVGAPLMHPVMLCGSMFGLGVRRHRNFEASFPIKAPSICSHKGQEIRAYYGAWGREAFRAKKPGNKDTLRGTLERAPRDMGIDWMDWKTLTQAIPPAYSEWIAKEFLRSLEC